MNYVYTKREVDKLQKLLYKALGLDKTVHAQRKLLQKAPQLLELLWNKNLRRIVKAIDDKAFLTKAIYFNKSDNANWYVSWHQDVAINVESRIDTTGFSGWTRKDDVISVLPPADVNQHCFSIRIHLDDTNDENGALKVLNGSHKKRFSDEEIQLITSNSTHTTVDVNAGGIHLMKPLLLHASTKTKSPRQRRVIHLEFSCYELPDGLSWAERIDLLDEVNPN